MGDEALGWGNRGPVSFTFGIPGDHYVLIGPFGQLVSKLPSQEKISARFFSGEDAIYGVPPQYDHLF